jgi:hypothetical protein
MDNDIKHLQEEVKKLGGAVVLITGFLNVASKDINSILTRLKTLEETVRYDILKGKY